MQMDQVALADIKSEGYMAVAKAGQNNRVALSDFAAQADLNQKIGDAPSDSKKYVRKNGAWSEMAFDSTISASSDNAVKNSVIYAAIGDIESLLAAL